MHYENAPALTHIPSPVILSPFAIMDTPPAHKTQGYANLFGMRALTASNTGGHTDKQDQFYYLQH